MTCPPYYDIWSSSNRMATSDLEALGEDTTDLVNGFSKYAEELKALTGFDILVEGTTDTYKDIYDIFEGISKVWGDLSDTSRARVSEILGGTRQLQVVSSIFSNMSDAAGAYSDALNSVGVASEANTTYMESVGAKADRMKAAFQEMANTIIDSNLIGMVYDVGTAFAEFLTLGDGFVAKAAIITAAILGISAAVSALKASSIGSFFASIAKIPSTLSTIGAVSSIFASGMQNAASSTSKLAAAFSILTPAQIANYASLSNLSREQLVAVLNMTALDQKTKDLIATMWNDAAANTADAAAKGANTAATGGLITALKGLWATILANPYLAIGAAIAGVIAGIVLYQKHQEEAFKEAIENAKELQEEYQNVTKTLSDNVSKVSELEVEFNKLASGVDNNGKNISLTNDEYSRYLEIVNDLVDINPGLVRGYNSEGQAIIDKNNAIAETIELLKEQQKLELYKATTPEQNWAILEGVSNEYIQAEKNLIGAKSDYELQLRDSWVSLQESIRNELNNSGNYDASGNLKSILGLNPNELRSRLIQAFQLSEEDFGAAEFADSWQRAFATIQNAINSADPNYGFVTNYAESYKELIDLLDPNQISAINNSQKSFVLLNNQLDRASLGYQSQLQRIAQASSGYDELSEGAQAFISQWISTMKIGGSETEKTAQEMTNSLQSMITLLADGTNDDSKILQEKMNALFSLDFSKMDAQQYNEWVAVAEDAIASIQEILGYYGKSLSEEEIAAIRAKIGLTLDFEINGQPATRESLIAEVKSKVEGMGWDSSNIDQLDLGVLKFLFTADFSQFDSTETAIDAYNTVVATAATESNNLKTALASLTDETTILRTALKALENGNLEKFLIGSDKKAENLKELISAFPELEDEINAYSKGLISVTELQRAFSLSLTISPIEQASDDLNKLSTALSNFKSKASLETSDFIDLQKIFGGLDEYQEFEKVASNSKSTFEQVKAAADKLGTAYLNTRDMLGDLNESTAEHTIIALKGIGVLNAEEVVYGRLAAQKNQNVIATRAFNDIEWEAASIQNMFATATLSVRDALNKFKNQQKETQAVTIDLTTATSAEIQAFTMLARAIGLTDTSLFNALSNMQKLKKAVEEGRYIGAYYNEYINSWQKTINDAFADFDISVPELNFSVPKGNISKGSSSSESKTQEYKAKIDKLHKQTQALEEIQNRIEKANAKAKLIDDKNYNELIKHHESLIEMYKEEQNALHDLATARRAVIQENVDKLREVGFNIDYNASDNSILIENMEHINQLAAKSKGTYSNLQEATNAYRKEIEELIKDTVDMVSANRDDSNSWWELQNSIRSAKVDVVNTLKEIVENASNAVDNLQNVYDTLHDVADEFAENEGFISVDAFQSLIDLGPQYMQYLKDENGLLVINEERINQVIAAKTRQLALDSAMSYVERLRLAAQEGSVENLEQLCFATEEATDATWNLVYSQLKAMQLSGQLTDAQYEAALHNIQAIRSLGDTAATSIGTAVGSLSGKLSDMQSGLDDIIKYVMDMLKQQINDEIDGIRDMIDNYNDLIAKKKESLQASKEEANYQKTVSNKLKEIAKLQSKIDALSLDSSREAQAEKVKLLEQMAELQEDLADTQADKALEAQEDSLDKMADAYEEEKEKEIGVLEDSISSYQKLYDKAIAYIGEHWETLYGELIDWNTQYGSVLNDEITNAWNNCLLAAEKYGDSVSDMLAGVKADIESINNSAANSLNTVVGVTGDQYKNENASVTGSQAQIAASMKQNSIAWWTASSSERANLETSQQNLAAQYRELTGDTGFNRTSDGTWRTGIGSPLYTITNSDKDAIAKQIVSNMQAISAQWYRGMDSATMSELEKQQFEWASRLQMLLGQSVTRDSNGKWWIGNQELYKVTNFGVYHKGGVAGDAPTLKQNEILAKLEKGEGIINDQKWKGLYTLVDTVDSLAGKFGAAVSKLQLGTFMQSSMSPSLAFAGVPEGIVSNSQVSPIQFGDNYFYGTPEENIKQHIELNSRLADKIFEYINPRR